jgi:hypothetical protein
MNRLDLTRGLEQAWNAFLAFAPKVVLAVVILVVGYVVARLLWRLLAGFLKAVGFDRLMERGGIQRALAKTNYQSSELLAKLVYYVLMLVVFQFAFAVFGTNTVSALLSEVIAFLPRLFVGLLIVVAASAIATAVRDLLQAALASLSYGRMLATLVAAFLVATGIFAALSHLGVAPAIVNGLYYAGLAMIAGSTIVAVGGGGIAPMRARWEKFLDRVEHEAAHPGEPGSSVLPDLTAPRAELWPKETAGNGPKKT